MDNDEVNKIIAEFMGLTYLDYPTFTKSLDALVPVWDKCGFFKSDEFPCFFMNGKLFYVELMVNGNMPFPWVSGEGETIQQAAAHATAKAIVELNNE